MEVIESLGFRIIKDKLSGIPLNDKILINTISPNSYGLAVRDPEMHQALKGSDFLVLDGLYFGLASMLLDGKKISRIAGWDCFQYFSEKINTIKGKVFFVGSTPETLAAIKIRYLSEYPDIQVESFSPPFRERFSEEDLLEMRQNINRFAPDVLFVGMTAPKQEKWGYQNKQYLDTHVIVTIGNVFDWYAGNSKRPGPFWQKMGLEWLVRIFYRPEILKRNLSNQMLFFWHLFLFVLKLKKHD